MMDLTGLPPVRRSTSGVLNIDTKSLRSSGWHESIRPADTGDPDHQVPRGEHRPGSPAAPRHARILEAADDQPASGSGEGTNLVARHPWANHQSVGIEPGGARGPRLPVGSRVRA